MPPLAGVWKEIRTEATIHVVSTYRLDVLAKALHVERSRAAVSLARKQSGLQVGIRPGRIPAN
jgi:hypothetical protein